MANGAAVNDAAMILMDFGAAFVAFEEILRQLYALVVSIFAGPGENIHSVVDVGALLTGLRCVRQMLVNLVHQVADEPGEHFLIFLARHSLRQERQAVVDGGQPRDVILLLFDVSDDVDGAAVLDDVSASQVEQIVDDLRSIQDVNVVVVVSVERLADVLPVAFVVVDAVVAGLLDVQDEIFLGRLRQVELFLGGAFFESEDELRRRVNVVVGVDRVVDGNVVKLLVVVIDAGSHESLLREFQRDVVAFDCDQWEARSFRPWRPEANDFTFAWVHRGYRCEQIVGDDGGAATGKNL